MVVADLENCCVWNPWTLIQNYLNHKNTYAKYKSHKQINTKNKILSTHLIIKYKLIAKANSIVNCFQKIISNFICFPCKIFILTNIIKSSIYT